MEDKEERIIRALRSKMAFDEGLRRRIRALQLLQQQHLLPPQPPPCRACQVDYSALTSFLDADRSFFSPWNWSPKSPPQAHDQENPRRNGRMNFQSGSFFSDDQELYNRMSGRDKEVGIRTTDHSKSHSR